jgi:hypothetical protein
MTRQGSRLVWMQMVVGMRDYILAVLLIWAVSAVVLLVGFAVAVHAAVWVHAALGAWAVAEAGFGVYMASVLRRRYVGPR